MERYVFLTPRDERFKNRKTITWSEAAAYPLCLLTSDMQNRRIVDMHFREAGAEVRAAIETNSLAAEKAQGASDGELFWYVTKGDVKKTREMFWSGRRDLNSGPPAPKAGALPGCATPRHAR